MLIVDDTKNTIRIKTEEDEKIEKELEKYKYSLAKTEITLEVGDTYELNQLIEITPKKEFNATFEVATTTIASVDDKNILTAKAEGKTNIKISVDGQNFNCIAIVKKAEDKQEQEKTTFDDEID
jgi:hypothetical protein